MSKTTQRRAFGILAASLFALAACDNKPAETKPEETTAKNSTTNATQPVNTVVTPTFADSDLVTPSDFQENADKSITKANYKTELATLETAVAKED